jgi:N-acetyl-alpha-D-glucosaminyl L-malate synthase BshA
MTARLRIGITCFPSIGGSGVIATEVGLELARRGHAVHFISSGSPWRLGSPAANVTLHEVAPRGYPLFEQGEYTLALTSRLVDVAKAERLDLFHMHYALPHAAAGFLAQQILGAGAPRMVTTLHGTDVTLVGSDPSYLPVTRFAIERSEAVTVPSTYLRGATYAELGVDPAKPIEVISNFVDTEAYAPPASPVRSPVLVHSSNFRPLKRVLDVVAVFALLRRQRPCTLVLTGDGPDRPAVEQRVRQLGLAESVTFLGPQARIAPVLRQARVFLLPSESESFGLAALEAMSCGVPVVGSRVGGLPEVVEDGASGFLLPVGDIAGMAEAARGLLDRDDHHDRFSQRARAIAVERFSRSPQVDRYEACYRRALGG